jgi:hypothetical protein
MGNIIEDAIKNGGNQVVMVTTSDLMTFAEFVLSKAKEYNQKESFADKEQLHPLNWWVQRMRFDRSTFWRWEKQGLIAPKRIGGKVYLKQSDFDNMGKMRA